MLDEDLTAQLQSILYRKSKTSIQSGYFIADTLMFFSLVPEGLPSVIFFLSSVVLMGLSGTSWYGSLLYPDDINGSVFPCPLRSGVLLRAR